MFKGEDSITFTSSKPFEQVSDQVEEAFRELGKVTISKKGGINIEPKSKYKTTFADSVIEGSLEQSKKTPTQFSLTLSYNVSPSVICWIVAVIGSITVCVGCLILLVPYKLKGELQKDVLKILSSVEDSVA
jgi:hypothetical protein